MLGGAELFERERQWSNSAVWGCLEPSGGDSRIECFLVITEAGPARQVWWEAVIEHSQG